VRDADQSLRDHPDPKLRDIWFSGFRRFEVEARQMAQLKATAAAQRRGQESGTLFFLLENLLKSME
jgi:hypothetical protein